MDEQNQAVFDAALALPEAERILLTRQLLDTLSEEEDEALDDDLLAELDRRRAEIGEGTAGSILWSQLRQEV
jgi:putative addiction module component (TIGR02574 family)